MSRLLIATRNLHKLQEIRTMLGDPVECVSLRDTPGAPEVVEDAPTFEGNAKKKAEALAEWILQMRSPECGVWNEIGLVLADDSGLEVDALGGAPGVHSARFAALDTGAAGNSSDADNNAKLLRLLKGVPEEKRTARFHCVLALVPVNPQSAIRNPQCFDGVCEGRIGFEPRGEHGFGYDPLFFPEGFDHSFAELGEDTKNQISHRSKALAKLADWLRQCPVG
jgi:XTP/dITP diphosphohydrolase